MKDSQLIIQNAIIKKIAELGDQATAKVIHEELATTYPDMDIREALLHLLAKDTIVADKDWMLTRVGF